MAVNVIDRWKLARYSAYQWRYELSVVKKVALALGFAALTGLLAQVRIPLPFTPVPITGQTFAALLAGVALGRWWGGISMAIYAALGIAGIPWFNGWSGGIGHLLGPTGGYIIGFVLSALVVGHLTDKYIKARNFFPILVLMIGANFILIYIPGLLQLYVWVNVVKDGSASVLKVLGMGLFPFIIGDIIKAAVAAGIGWGVTPKQPYGGEVDKLK